MQHLASQLSKIFWGWYPRTLTAGERPPPAPNTQTGLWPGAGRKLPGVGTQTLPPSTFQLWLRPWYGVDATNLEVTSNCLVLRSSGRSRTVRNLLLRMRAVAICRQLDSMNTCTLKNWTLPIHDVLDKASVPATLCYCLVNVGYARLFSFSYLPTITSFLFNYVVFG